MNWQIRLPGEAEWEKAARGTDGRRYPWGEEPDPNLANYNETGIGTTSAVGAFPGGESPYGCEEMSGNVWEWCSTKEEKAYPFTVRVLRGGAFAYNQDIVRCASRRGNNPVSRLRSRGFCIVLSPF